MVKNGNFTLLLMCSNQEWQLHTVITSSVQEWPFHIATDLYWLRMAILHCYWYLVVKNDNFTLSLYSMEKNGNLILLLTPTGKEWHFHTATNIHWTRMGISHCYWHLVLKNCNLTLLITSSSQEWQFDIATDI